MEEELKTKHIILKFTELKCPVIDSENQNCLSEILFKPTLERYALLQWCLEKLGLTIELKEHVTSLDNKVQSFLNSYSSLGLCSQNDADIIEGTAPLSKQLIFWEILSCFLSENEAISKTEDESNDSNETCFVQNISEYEQCCDYIRSILSSAHLNTLFDRKLQLFPTFFQKEVSRTLSKENFSLSSKNVKKIFSEKLCKEENNVTADYSVGNKSFEVKETKDNIIPNEDNLVKIEDDISESLNKLHTFSFDSVYNDLKPYLPDAPSNDFVDIGPVFKTAANKLESVLKLKCSSAALKSADTDLQSLSSDISNIQPSSDNLSNTKLEEYISILSEKNIEK